MGAHRPKPTNQPRPNPSPGPRPSGDRIATALERIADAMERDIAMREVSHKKLDDLLGDHKSAVKRPPPNVPEGWKVMGYGDHGPGPLPDNLPDE